MKNVVYGVLHDLNVIDHWNRDPLPLPGGWEEPYQPDYYGEYVGYPITLVEIKKPGAIDDELQGGYKEVAMYGKANAGPHGLRRCNQYRKSSRFLVKESHCKNRLEPLNPPSNKSIPGQRDNGFIRGRSDTG
ncbi:MAG: hypothetical protein J3Q66DRAFT_372754 [Benniella sp.]|nr:MAG: hypothetical protein J3Q66DRAFT_372754 [Benniella sp.]